jgi:hypothetical protein
MGETCQEVSNSNFGGKWASCPALDQIVPKPKLELPVLTYPTGFVKSSSTIGEFTK